MGVLGKPRVLRDWGPRQRGERRADAGGTEVNGAVGGGCRGDRRQRGRGSRGLGVEVMRTVQGGREGLGVMLRAQGQPVSSVPRRQRGLPRVRPSL